MQAWATFVAYHSKTKVKLKTVFTSNVTKLIWNSKCKAQVKIITSNYNATTNTKHEMQWEGRSQYSPTKWRLLIVQYEFQIYKHGLKSNKPTHWFKTQQISPEPQWMGAVFIAIGCELSAPCCSFTIPHAYRLAIAVGCQVYSVLGNGSRRNAVQRICNSQTWKGPS